MTSETLAPVAPVTFADLADALRAARGAEPLSPRHLDSLNRPPASFVVDELDAERDGYLSGRGRLDVRDYTRFLLDRHAERRAVVARTIEALRTKAALPLGEIESLARRIMDLRPIPDELAAALEMPSDPPRSRCADRAESLLKLYANAARKRSF